MDYYRVTFTKTVSKVFYVLAKDKEAAEEAAYDDWKRQNFNELVEQADCFDTCEVEIEPDAT